MGGVITNTRWWVCDKENNTYFINKYALFNM